MKLSVYVSVFLSLSLLLSAPAAPEDLERELVKVDMNLATLRWVVREKHKNAPTEDQLDIAEDIFLAFALRRRDTFNPTAVWVAATPEELEITGAVAEVLTATHGHIFHFYLTRDEDSGKLDQRFPPNSVLVVHDVPLLVARSGLLNAETALLKFFTHQARTNSVVLILDDREIYKQVSPVMGRRVFEMADGTLHERLCEDDLPAKP